MMDLKHTAKLKNGVFYVEENGEKLADMTYVFAGDTQFIIDHLEVLPGNEERDLGKLMVEAAVDFARKKRLKIVPLSPFAKGFFDKTPDYADVLA